jgi:hypothetical protein
MFMDIFHQYVAKQEKNMTSAKKIAANQDNAKHSSGARTEAGKQR